MRISLKTLRAGLGPLGGEVEVRPGEREILNPLFVLLRDRRALLQSSHRRHPHMPYVTQSIKDIRDELTNTLRQLGPDSDARVWLEKLRAACREFLTAVESKDHLDGQWADFEPALIQLRAAFQEVANHVAAYYRLPVARDLADEMARNPDL